MHPLYDRWSPTLRRAVSLDDAEDAQKHEGTGRPWWLWPVPKNRETVLAWAFLAFAVGFQAFCLRSELSANVPGINDGVLHEMLLDRTVTALRSGTDPTDAWFAQVTTGYPTFHHYQHLPFLPPALVVWAFDADGHTVYQWTLYLLLCVFPISVYWSMRRFGFVPLAAGLAAVVSPVISTDGLFGFDDVSYVWRGYGMYTQLWGMVLLPPTLAQGYRTLRKGDGYVWSVALLAALLLSHLVLGYIALVTLAAFVFLDLRWREVRSRGVRLGLLFVLAGIVSSYFLVGVIRDNGYLARSAYEVQTKYDAFGADWTLRALFNGRLFDDLRAPWLTAVVLAGVVTCALRWREEIYRIPALVFALWLVLYFGKPTLGVLSGLGTLHFDFYLHRLIAGVHMGGILLMGVALAIPWRWALVRRRAWYLLAPAAITLLVLVPVYRERREYLRVNDDLIAYNQDARAADDANLQALFRTLHEQPPGRVYAGLPGRWGKDYKVGSVPVSHLLANEGFDMIGYFYYPFSLNADMISNLDEGKAEQYNLFNIRYVVAPPDRAFDPDLVKPLATFGRYKVYRVLTSGYFDLVSSDVTLMGNKDQHFGAALAWLDSGLPAAKQHPTIVFDASGQSTGPTFGLADSPRVLGERSFSAGEPRGDVVSERVEENTYVGEVEVQRPSMLMLKETFHPGWHATIDGRPVDPVMLMPSYVGVPVTPGRHLVRFEYRPPRSRRFLIAIGLVTLGMVAALEWIGPRLQWHPARLAVRGSSVFRRS
jgi:hypothetical protein